MNISVCTIFPELLSEFFKVGLMGKAVENNVISVTLLNPRDFTTDKHLKTDDMPYGGGAGMVMTPQPLADCIEHTKSNNQNSRVIFMSPQGKTLTTSKAKQLAKDYFNSGLIIVCGRYEGIDARIRAHFIDEEISIGDYILNGGEVGAMVLIEAVTRFLPGFMGNDASLSEESHENFLLEYPHYTRPQNFRGYNVPEILLSGHHAKIKQWRLEQSIKRTKQIRPDLYQKYLEIIRNNGETDE